MGKILWRQAWELLTTGLAALIALFLLQGLSSACSLTGCPDGGNEMRPAFTVTVTHADKPIAGVRFHIVAKGIDQFSGVTDRNGTVSVQRLMPGEHWLSADLLGIAAAYMCFHISAKQSKSAKDKLSFTWGDDAPGTSRLAGRLFDSQPGKGGTPLWNLVHRSEVPIVGASLRLQDPITHAVYIASSDQEGGFNFDGVSSGTYVLHIEGGEPASRGYDATDQLVRLDGSATRNFLVFKRREGGAGSCGGTSLELQSD